MSGAGSRVPARLVGTTLVALLIARAALAFVPSMWAWGLNVQRFLAPIPACVPWGIAALLLIPAVAARITPGLARLGDRLTGGAGAWMAPLAAAALVWMLPDRVWITGDFMVRQGAGESGAIPASFIQALPLEVFLDRTLPRLFGPGAPLDPNPGARLIGAISAAALALAARGLARAWGLTGGAALVAGATVFFGGWLVCFTGLGKPAAPLVALAALAVLGGTRLVQSGRGGTTLGLAVAVALLLHRSALAFLPLWIAALVLARRAHDPLAGATRRSWWLAALLPAAAACVSLPMIARILVAWDLPHHLMPAAVRGPGPLAAAFAPLHLLDLANLFVLMTPALIVAVALLLAGGARGTRPTRPKAAAMLPALLAIAFVPAWLFVHPIHGIPRDLEDFAPAGVALAMVAARWLGGAIEARRLPATLAPALVAAVAMPALQWLLHFHDPARGLDRARALALEAPARSDDERARLWDALAFRAFRDRRWEQAVEAGAQSVRYAPHPRALAMLAIARTYTGDHRGAESLYVVLTGRTPDDPLAWLGLGGSALRVGDSVQARRALARLNAYPPRGPEARLVRRHLRLFPEVWPAAPDSIAVDRDPTRR